MQAAISAASRDLPQNMPRPPTFRKVNPADSPILYLGVSSSTLPLSEVDEYAEVNIAQRISTVNGVAQVDVYGSQKYAVRVQVDPDALASRGIGIEEVRTALAQGQLQSSRRHAGRPQQGLHDRDHRTALIGGPVPAVDRQLSQRSSGSSGRDRARNGQRRERTRTASWFNGKRSILLAIQRQPGTNTVEIVDGIRKMLPALQQQMPAGMELGILFDRSQPIRESIEDVKVTLLIAIGLVVAVIFVFLRNPSATIIPSLAVPISILGTFAVMNLLGLHARQPVGNGHYVVGRVRRR